MHEMQTIVTNVCEKRQIAQSFMFFSYLLRWPALSVLIFFIFFNDEIYENVFQNMN